MARQRYDPWKGYSSAELANISPQQISGMGVRELRALVTRLSSAANKRMRSMERAGETSPQYAAAKRVGRFSAKGKTDLGLQHEYLRVSQFMRSSATTIKGAREARRRGLQKAAEALGFEGDFLTQLSEDEQKQYWDLFSRYSEQYRNMNVVNYKQGLARAVKKYVKRGYSTDDIERILSRRLKKDMKRQQDAVRDANAARSNLFG